MEATRSSHFRASLWIFFERLETCCRSIQLEVDQKRSKTWNESEVKELLVGSNFSPACASFLTGYKLESGGGDKQLLDLTLVPACGSFSTEYKLERN